MTCTAYIDAGASTETLEQLRGRVERTSPLLDILGNEVALETDVVEVTNSLEDR